MTRAALLAVLALAACSPDPPPSCPGQAVGTFAFGPATLTTTLAPGLDPDSGSPDCGGALGFPLALPAFDGTLAAEEGTTAGALCMASGQVLFGSHTGLRWVVEVSSGGGAVLGACGPTCAASSRVVISGDVLPTLADPTEFRGALVEQLTRSEGDCGACLPCAARYEFHGTEVSP